jgi:hypothetical protein
MVVPANVALIFMNEGDNPQEARRSARRRARSPPTILKVEHLR